MCKCVDASNTNTHRAARILCHKLGARAFTLYRMHVRMLIECVCVGMSASWLASQTLNPTHYKRCCCISCYTTHTKHHAAVPDNLARCMLAQANSSGLAVHAQSETLCAPRQTQTQPTANLQTQLSTHLASEPPSSCCKQHTGAAADAALLLLN